MVITLRGLFLKNSISNTSTNLFHKLKSENMKRQRSTKQQIKERNELLQRLGISQQTYYNYRQGRTPIPVVLYPYLNELKLTLK